MFINKMICEYCGKEFYTEYYTGGYIDHYINFAQHKDGFGDVNHDVREICYDGNNLRDYDDIRDRLDCYLKWDNISDNVKQKVQEKCKFLINKMIIAEQKSRKIVSGLTMLERKYLIKAAQCNCGIPYGNEDGKLWNKI